MLVLFVSTHLCSAFVMAWGLLSYIISDAIVLHCWLGCLFFSFRREIDEKSKKCKLELWQVVCQPIFAVLFVAWGLLSYIISYAFVLQS